MTDVIQERIKSLKQRLARDPQSPLFARLASYYLSAGRANDALRLCDDGLALYPFYSTAHLVKGKALIELGMKAEAKHEYETVHELLPTSETVARLYSSIDLGPSTELTTAPVAEEAVETEIPVEPTPSPVVERTAPQRPVVTEDAFGVAEAPAPPEFVAEQLQAQEFVTEELPAPEPTEAAPAVEPSYGFDVTPVAEVEQPPPTAAEVLAPEVMEQQPAEPDYGFGAPAEEPPTPIVEEAPVAAPPVEEPQPTIERAPELPQEIPTAELTRLEAAPVTPEPTPIETPTAVPEQVPDWMEAFGQLQQPTAEVEETPAAAPQEEENPFAVFGAEQTPAAAGESYDEFASRTRMELFGTEDAMALDDYLGTTAPAQTPGVSPDNIGDLAEKLKSSQRITPPVINYSEKAPRPSTEGESSSGSGFATPTLAEIYVKQGWYDDAIKAYRALATNRPAEREKFEQRIAEIEELKKKQ